MSRYDWPPGPRRSRDDVAGRRAWNVGRDAGTDREAVASARALRRGAAAATPVGLPPSGAAELWLPLGPTTTLRGPSEGEGRSAGRVRDMQVSDDGQRIYAASALGGLWYSADAGATWEPVGAFAATRDRGTITPASTTLACGAVYVHFAPAGTPDPHTVDEVWLGTGEPNPNQQPTDFGVVGYYGGVGILHAVGPVGLVRGGNPDPWDRQAQPRVGPPAYTGLRGAGIFAFAADPADPRRIVAATTRGLHVHDPAAPAGSDPWSAVIDPTWDGRAGSPGSAALVFTDAVWTPGDAATGDPARLWVAIRQTGTALTGVWRSDAGAAGPFNEIVLPGARTGAGGPQVARLGLAAAPSDRTVVYVLGSGPRMWRLDGPATVRRVTGLPGELFGTGGADSSDYALAIAVDPASARRFLIGGLAVTGPDDDLPAAALYRLSVPAAAPTGANPWRTDYVGGNVFDARWVGQSVHADVHRIRWVAGPATPPVLVATDGGAYLSTASADRGSFASRASGMAVSEPGYIASHPDTDGTALIGCQDNAAQLQLGGTWRRVPPLGDAGGVAFDPGVRGQLIAQMVNSHWAVQGEVWVSPTLRTTENAPFNTEHGASRFYSNAAARRRADGVTQLVIGTRRVWYTERWGASRWDGVAGVWRREWMTIPSRTDPRAGDAPDTTTDDLAPGPFPAGTVDSSSGIRALRWGADHRLYALLPGAVYRLDRDPGTMRWATPVTRIVQRPAMPAVGGPPAAAAGPNLPPDGTLNDLAVHDATAGPHGSFYLATSHPTEPVWWFDGTGTWHPAGLGVLAAVQPPPPGTTDGVRAPAYAVVVDPDHPDIVFAGTAVGVWRGELTPGAPPTWVWRPLLNGLPEAAVQDLAIDSWPDPAGGRRRLMRAALQARGAWEIDLDAAATAVTFVRTHEYDTRRLAPVPMDDPMFLPARPDRDWTYDWALRRNRDHRTAAGAPANHPDGTPAAELLWHASPDIRLRPAPGVPLPPPLTTLPWTAVPADRFALWALQTALHAIDQLVVPDGRWTAAFRRRLRAIRVARGMSDTARVDAGLWSHLDVQAGFWADPWADGGPTEADLIERIVGMATARPGGAGARAVSGASVGLPAGAAHVDVAVHRRALLDAAPSDVAVLLLRFPLPIGAAPNPGPPDWAATTAPPLAGLEAAMEAVPAAGGPLPGAVALPVGWDAPDTALAIRRPPRAARTADAAIVTFDVNMAAGTWMLLAVVHHGPGTPALTGAADLRDLVRRSPHIAARSVEVV
ncbi:MAG: hypothetical protein ACXVFM_00235 [Solirubrobacteraceae bacterium]